MSPTFRQVGFVPSHFFTKSIQNPDFEICRSAPICVIV